MTGETLYPRLEPLLAQIQKPIQYVGGELNAQVKEWDGAAVHWALMYPDAYEVGLPNQGVQILYEVLNERPDVLAERTYAVWPDLEALMREHGIPQFTVDGHRAGRATSTCSASASPPSSATPTCSTALDLAGIPLHAVDRDETHPVVIAGGHAAFNPEPIADFVDAAVLGDGEQVVGDITDVVRDVEGRGHARRPRRAAGPPGARRTASTCRASTTSTTPPTARIARGRAATGPTSRARVGKHTVMDLDEWPYPKKPLVPLAETRARADERRDLPRLHPRLPLLPGRDDHPPGARAVASPASARWSRTASGDRLRGGRAAVAVQRRPLRDRPSWPRGWPTATRAPTSACRCRRTRVDAFNITLANEFSRNGRRSGLTFAPEGGSERMRRVINKMVTEEDLIRTVATAYAHGWRQVKLYFMCGLPTETDEDVLEIADLADEVIRGRPRGQRAARTSAARCRSAASCPSRTRRSSGPRQPSAETIDDRLRQAARRRSTATGGTAAAIGFRYHDGKPGDRSRDCSPAATAASARSSSRSGATAAGSTAGASTSPTTAGSTAAAGGAAPAPASTSTGSPPASATTTRCCPGTTSTPASTRTGSGRTGRTRSIRRERGRGLPLDALLRLRRLPDDGHRDPDRPDRAQPAARSPSSDGARQPERPAPAADRPEAAHPVRQARPAAVRLATATSRAPSSGRCGGPQVPMAFSAGFSPHPKISYARRRAHRRRRARPSTSRSALAEPLRPRGGAGRAGRRAARRRRRPGVRRGGRGDRLAGRPDRHLRLAGRAARRRPWPSSQPAVDEVPRRRRGHRRQAHQERAARTSTPARRVTSASAAERRGLCHTARGRPAA